MKRSNGRTISVATASAAIVAAVTFVLLPPVMAQNRPAATSPRQERLEAARKWHDAIEQGLRVGHGVVDPETRFIWSKRLMDCEMDLAGDAQAKQKAIASHVERMKALRDRLHGAYQAGESPSRQTIAGDYYYADARAVAGEK